MLGVETAVLRGFLTRTEAAEWRQRVFSLPDVGSLLELFFDGDFRGVLLSPLVQTLLLGDGGHVGQDGGHVGQDGGHVGQDGGHVGQDGGHVGQDGGHVGQDGGHVGQEGGHVGQDGGHVGQDIETHLEKTLMLYLSSASEHRELVLLVLAASCLQLFTQSNWTGPPPDLQDSDILPPALLQTTNLSTVQGQASVRDSVLSCLLLDGDSVYGLVSNPLLLLLSRVLLTSIAENMASLQLVRWWTLRYVALHQQVLEACSPQLLSLAQSSIKSVTLKLPLLQEQSLLLQFHVECVYVNLSYYEHEAVQEHMRNAQRLTALSVSMTGALGKRTRFQDKSVAQLVLEVKREEPPDWTNTDTSPAPTPVSLLPKDCSLNDDTRLERISLEDPDQFRLPDLSPEEQVTVLALCSDFQKNNPLHKLTEEELLTFSSALLSQPKLVAVQAAALSLRTRLERGQRRCVERAMMQTQVLVDYFEERSCPVSERLKLFHCCRPPPRWTIQKTLASLLTDLGCTSSALLMFETLQLWEDVVVCYERLGQHGKAEAVLRRELARGETPPLLCLLGDVLKQHPFYDRAWELSGHRSARAMRSKGLLHLAQRHLQEAAHCFEESLRVNRMQLGLWFSLGCTYLALQNYEGAARAFQSCVGLEPDNAEAWNNLSTAYIRLRKDYKAFLTLQEALKCNYESWQIWENFLLVSTNIGAFREAIGALHRLMDLRDGYKDLEVLEVLVGAVVKDLPDQEGAPCSALKPKLKELLGRVSSRHSREGAVWRQYALLYGEGRSDCAEDNDKALQFLSKALRCELQTGGWDQDPALFKGVLQRALSMGQVSLTVAWAKSSPAEALQVLSSSRLSLSGLVSKAKQNHVDPATAEVQAELRDEVQALEKLVSEIQEVSTALRSQSQ